MPNTPALVGKGASAFALGHFANSSDSKLVGIFLSAIGISFEVKEG
jgi:pyrroline-5-carboxylate reductase